MKLGVFLKVWGLAPEVRGLGPEVWGLDPEVNESRHVHRECRGAGHITADSPGGLSEAFMGLATAGSKLSIL